MPNRNSIGIDGGLLADRGLKGAWELPAEREYITTNVVKPRRNAPREKPQLLTGLELRAVGSPIPQDIEGGMNRSVLEQIVGKRLEILWGPMGVAWDYQKTDAGKFIDFAIYNRPSGKVLALEPQGAHWHGPDEQYHDLNRILFLLSLGYDFAEIWEYEIIMGDEFLDNRLMQLIGASGSWVIPSENPNFRPRRNEVLSFNRRLGTTKL